MASIVVEQGGAKLDRHYLSTSQGSQFASTIDMGLKWTVIPYKIESRFPQLPHFFQKALNSEHHIGEGETWDEQLRGLAKSIVEYAQEAKKRDDVPYSKIRRAALASKPPREIDIPAQIEFCKKWGGGKHQGFVFDICDYCKLAKSSAIVAASTFESLNRLKMPSDNMCPDFIAAIVKCAATRGRISNGVSAHLSDNDIKKTPQAGRTNIDHSLSMPVFVIFWSFSYFVGSVFILNVLKTSSSVLCLMFHTCRL